MGVLDLAGAKQHLNIPATSTTNDGEITAWLDTLDAVIERYIGGPIVTREVVQRVTPVDRGTALLLGKIPVVDVTQINGDAVSGLDIDPDAGMVRGSFGSAPVTVTYQAGRGDTPPPAIVGAAKVILGHLWQTQRGQLQRPSLGGDETFAPLGLGFAVPNRALELLAPFAVEAWA